MEEKPKRVYNIEEYLEAVKTSKKDELIIFDEL